MLGLQIYLMDIHIWYTIMSAVVGGVMGARARLGEVYGFQSDEFLGI